MKKSNTRRNVRTNKKNHSIWLYLVLFVMATLLCTVITIISSNDTITGLNLEESNYQLEYESAPLYTKPTSNAKTAIKQNYIGKGKAYNFIHNNRKSRIEKNKILKDFTEYSEQSNL